MSIARYRAATTGKFTGTLKDADGTAISNANLLTITLSLRDAETKALVNSRDAQDVLGGAGGTGANNVTVDSNGALIWSIQTGDTAIQTANIASEDHIATFIWTFTSGGQTKTGSATHVLHCVDFVPLCSFDDVKQQLPAISDEDQDFVEMLIEGFAARAETETGRKFRRKIVTETFSVNAGQRSLRVSRYPIESVTSLKEDLGGVFGDDPTVTSTEGNPALPGYPASNLLDPNTSIKWAIAWADVTTDKARVVVDLVDEVSPTVFKLEDCNAKSGRVRLYGADDAALSENVIYYDFDLSGTHVFYPSTATTSVRFATAGDIDRYPLVTTALPTGATYDWPSGLVTYGDLARRFGRTSYGIRLVSANVRRSAWVHYSGAARAAYWLYDDGFQLQYGPYPRGGPSSVGATPDQMALVPSNSTCSEDCAHLAGESGNVFSFIRTDHYSDSAEYWVGDSSSAAGARNQVVTVGIRPDAASASDVVNIFGWGDLVSNNSGLYFDRAGEEFVFRQEPEDSGGGSAEFAFAASSFMDGGWHVVTVVYQETVAGVTGTAELWVDGVSLGTATLPVTTGFPSGPVHSLGLGGPIGEDNPGAADYAYLAQARNDSTYSDGDYASWVAASNAEAMHLVGLSTDTLKRRYWAIDFDGVTSLGVTSRLEVGHIDFGTLHSSRYDPTNYYVDADAGTVALRYSTFLGGVGSVQVVYSGGLLEKIDDVSGATSVPWDLRMAAIRQVTYWYQRRSSLGVASESVSGMSVSLTVEQDLLPDVRAVLSQYSPTTLV